MLFVTTNEGKFREVREMATGYGIEIEWLKKEYLEPQGSELEEIARKSAELLAKEIKKPFFIEDSGLFVEALSGFPGPYSSYVFRTIGNEGILRLMRGVDNRKAYFKAVIAYFDGKTIHVFTGVVEGEIADQLRGSRGFGFDPIFLYGDRTFAEMGVEEKNKYSHRRKAFESFFKWLNS
jgi:XTP/dITP diphosphohydrolase